MITKLVHKFSRESPGKYEQVTFARGYQLMSRATATQEDIDMVKKHYPGSPIYFIEDLPELMEKDDPETIEVCQNKAEGK
jgi:hypothetical protein